MSQDALERAQQDKADVEQAASAAQATARQAEEEVCVCV